MFTTYEREKLLISMAAIVAKNRKFSGLKLNYPEAVSIVASQIMEWVREGKSVSEIISIGITVLKKEDLIEGV